MFPFIFDSIWFLYKISLLVYFKDYQMQLQLLDNQQSIHKQPGLGSIASLLGQDKTVETKVYNE